MLRHLLLALLLVSALAAHAQPVAIALDLGTYERDLTGVTVGVRGDTAPLSWERSLALTDPDGDGVYTAEVPFPDGTGAVEYRALLERADVLEQTDAEPEWEPEWEPGDSRVLVPGLMATDRRSFGEPQTNLPEATVTHAELAEDLALLQEAMEALHPGLRLHNTDEALAALLDRLANDAQRLAATYGDAIPVTSIYLPLVRAVAAIRDGHTQVSMYNQTAYTEALLYDRADRVPFTFRLIPEGTGARMLVTGDATPDLTLPAGTEVLTLDGRPVAEVIAALMPYASADGSNDAKRIGLLEVGDLVAPAERFDVVYSEHFAPEGDLALTVRTPGSSGTGTEHSLTVPRMTADARRDVLWARDPDLPRSRGDLLDYAFLDDGTAYLRVGSFATFSMDVDYAAWLVGAFQAIRERGAERLVVDLRGNGGGMNDAAVLLYTHLITAPLDVMLWKSMTVYQSVPPGLRPHLRSWSDDFYDLGDRVTPQGDGTYAFAPPQPIPVAPAPDAFDGRAAVLIDVGPSSATFLLADAIQRTGVVPLVGQTTGGSLKGINGGQTVFLELPHTGLVVDIPLYGSRPLTPGPDHGVIPDVLVEPEVAALVAGRDPELEAALALLSRDPDPVPADEEPSAGEAAATPLPFDALAGGWTGTLTYTDYSDDTTQATLTISASGRALRRGGARLGLRYVRADGSSSAMGTMTLRERRGQVEYGGEAWTELEREVRPDGFRLVLEREGEDNRRPATIRHTIALNGDALTDQKDVRYDGTEVFVMRNVYRLVRAE
ncbi:MAG: S41 family peptidase [Bacteroidota bacterium]